MATSTAAGKKRMTQSDVINYFAERTGMKRAQVKQLFEDLGNLATSEVNTNGEFVLPGFGKLVRSERKVREGRDRASGGPAPLFPFVWQILVFRSAPNCRSPPPPSGPASSLVLGEHPALSRKS